MVEEFKDKEAHLKAVLTRKSDILKSLQTTLDMKQRQLKKKEIRSKILWQLFYLLCFSCFLFTLFVIQMYDIEQS